MSVESAVITAVEHTAEGAATSVAGSVVGAAASASNPISSFGTALKVGTYIAGAALMGFMLWKLWSFIETAAADAAAVKTLTSQVSDLKSVNAANEAAFKAKLAERDIVVAKTNKLADDLAAAKATVEAQREELRHAPSTANYRATPADQQFLDGLRKPTR
jgi:hypothetical protein